MGSSQQFSLRWNNYLNHITGAFDTLRNDDELVDVTLSCEGKRIKAHKMLLSVCSTYFRDLFKENPCQHPVIIFRNVKFEDLVALIDFMYHGEVNVMQEQLTSFLTTAELLAVQGLSEDKGKEQEKDDSPLPDTEVDLTDSPPPPPPPVHDTEASVSNSSHMGLMRHNRQRTSSPRSPPQAPAFFPSTSNVERRPDSPPHKRRRWLSSQQPMTKPAAVSVPSRKCDDEGSGSPPPPPSPARRQVTDPTPETSEIAPPAPNPSVKMEIPDYVEESRTRADQSQLPSATGVENDSLASMAQLVAAKTEGASSPTQGVSSAPPDLADLYGGSSRDAGATSDSLSAAELSQILSKPGPSGESQSQDSLHVLQRGEATEDFHGSATIARLSQRHFPNRVKMPEGKKKAQRRCVVCSEMLRNITGKAGRKDSSYECSECNVGLCVTPCFKIYHTVAHYDKYGVWQ